MRRKRQVYVRERYIDRLTGEAQERFAHLTECLPPGFPLEKTLAKLGVLHAEMQLKVLREGIPQPWPKSAAPAE